MSKPASEVVDDLRDLLNKKGKDVLTLSWPEFYEIAERERIKESFTDAVVLKAKESSLIVHFANAIVLVAKDYKFAPTNG
ncbi:hypothetical protein [Herbaspirillum sp. RV1423]|uniref:hypothetical protein n=1 Tax=Herbaspirillum sp. RV1423 TaxID=1443993 RepID=UPI00055169AD|nr:hypothetical protein [Herbaspirillum sp. RV1423]